MDKEFVLVSQGMEIMSTKSQENAINYVKEQNDKWFDYVQECKDNYERYADNYIELYVEDEYTKKIEQENKQLKERIDKAIEYMQNYDLMDRHGNSYCKDELIDILKGEYL